jgi:hypothetical protein
MTMRIARNPRKQNSAPTKIANTPTTTSLIRAVCPIRTADAVLDARRSSTSSFAALRALCYDMRTMPIALAPVETNTSAAAWSARRG